MTVAVMREKGNQSERRDVNDIDRTQSKQGSGANQVWRG